MVGLSSHCYSPSLSTSHENSETYFYNYMEDTDNADCNLAFLGLKKNTISVNLFSQSYWKNGDNYNLKDPYVDVPADTSYFIYVDTNTNLFYLTTSKNLLYCHPIHYSFMTDVYLSFTVCDQDEYLLTESKPELDSQALSIYHHSIEDYVSQLFSSLQKQPLSSNIILIKYIFNHLLFSLYHSSISLWNSYSYCYIFYSYLQYLISGYQTMPFEDLPGMSLSF